MKTVGRGRGEKFAVSDLRATPGFIGIVADRIWREWWAPHGAALRDVERALGDCLDERDLPFTLVVSQGSLFLGTVTVVVSDLSERPQYSPWIAALWVEPEYRGRGLGEALMGEAESRVPRTVGETVYLCAKPHLRRYYRARGWQHIEERVGNDLLDVWRRLATSRSP
jgi:GNAT superfamily N-acetyltransferase